MAIINNIGNMVQNIQLYINLYSKSNVDHFEHLYDSVTILQ